MEVITSTHYHLIDDFKKIKLILLQPLLDDNEVFVDYVEIPEWFTDYMAMLKDNILQEKPLPVEGLSKLEQTILHLSNLGEFVSELKEFLYPLKEDYQEWYTLYDNLEAFFSDIHRMVAEELMYQSCVKLERYDPFLFDPTRDDLHLAFYRVNISFDHEKTFHNYNVISALFSDWFISSVCDNYTPFIKVFDEKGEIIREYLKVFNMNDLNQFYQWLRTWADVYLWKDLKINLLNQLRGKLTCQTI